MCSMTLAAVTENGTRFSPRQRATHAEPLDELDGTLCKVCRTAPSQPTASLISETRPAKRRLAAAEEAALMPPHTGLTWRGATAAWGDTSSK
jgi:hypothetical protein